MKKSELEQRNRELEEICYRQRDSLAAQQEAIVQLNEIMDKTVAVITEKYGYCNGCDEKKLRFSVERFNNILENHKISVVGDEHEFVATLSKT